MKFVITFFALLSIFLNNSTIASGFTWDEARESHHGSQQIKVYRSPNCNCCHNWIKHLEKHQFTVIDMLIHDMNTVKEALKLPAKMASCHTAIIDDYIIEGHVPADDIKQLLKDKPDIAGLSVPQMPVGTPGMEVGARKDNFIVFQFNKDGHYRIYNQYLLTGMNEYKAHPAEDNH